MTNNNLDQNLIEREFPFLKNVIFLNVSSVSMAPISGQNAYKGFFDRYINNFGEDVVGYAWDIVNDTRIHLAKLINAESSEIGFVKNTCEGISIISNGYPFKKGDNVIVADLEHTSNLYAWIAAQRRGVELKVIKNVNGEVLMSDIIKNIDSKTKVIAISAVQFTTGFYADLEAIGKIAKEKNILFVVDGIQAIGRLNIDVKKMNIDYLACGSNKGLLATLGSGFVYCSNRIVKDIIPVYASYQSVENHIPPPAITDDFSELHFYDSARRFESGNLNYAAIAAIREGVKIINALSIEAIEKHVLMLDKYLRERISKLHLKYNEFKDDKNYSGIICVFYNKNKEKEVIDILKDNKIYATMRGGYIRLGIDFYNTEKDMDIVYEALAKIEKLN